MRLVPITNVDIVEVMTNGKHDICNGAFRLVFRDNGDRPAHPNVTCTVCGARVPRMSVNKETRSEIYGCDCGAQMFMTTKAPEGGKP